VSELVYQSSSKLLVHCALIGRLAACAVTVLQPTIREKWGIWVSTLCGLTLGFAKPPQIILSSIKVSELVYQSSSELLVHCALIGRLAACAVTVLQPTIREKWGIWVSTLCGLTLGFATPP